jgi:hypothetical protein
LLNFLRRPVFNRYRALFALPLQARLGLNKDIQHLVTADIRDGLRLDDHHYAQGIASLRVDRRLAARTDNRPGIQIGARDLARCLANFVKLQHAQSLPDIALKASTGL